MSNMRPSALAVAIALHLAMIALVLSGALEHPRTDIEPPAVVVQLLTPPPKPEPPPPEPPKPKPPKPEPPKPEPPKPEPPKPEPPKPEPPKPEPTPEPPKPEPAKPEPPKPAPKAEPVKVDTPPPPVAAPQAPAAVAPPPTPPAPPAPPAPKTTARTEVSISASYAAANRKPEYPKMSQRLGEEGTVVLTVMVKSDGSASEVEVKSSSGFARLDRAAADAVKTWRFNPATVDGKAVDKSYEVPITFKPPN